MSARLSRWRVPGEAAAAAVLLTLYGLMHLPTAASATTTGSIAGTVTAPMGVQIVATICAIASDGEEVCATALATNINGNSPGAYRISGLASGEYKVSFAARCSVEPCHETFPPQYYDDQISLARATLVKVSAAETLGGIDASIEGAGERSTREYLENQPPAQPTGERSGTLPGAIEPLPVNKQVEEEFWAHPPWDKASSTPAATPAAPLASTAAGVAVVARQAAVRGASVDVALRCAGGGACAGMLGLVETLTKKTFVERDGKRLAVKLVRKIPIGTAGFSLAAGVTETLRVHLTRVGRTLTRTAASRTLKVQVTGSGVKSGVLVLK